MLTGSIHKRHRQDHARFVDALTHVYAQTMREHLATNQRISTNLTDTCGQPNCAQGVEHNDGIMRCLHCKRVRPRRVWLPPF